MTKKIKVLTLSDHPLSPSGVGIQTRYMIEGLLQTGKFEVASFGGAIKHQSYEPTRVDEYGDAWTIYPVDGYGTQDSIRSIIRNERPDILWFMTDPRFYGWLWQMEDEVRPLMPMVYYHVWDNFPAPKFNGMWYDSTDTIVTISKVTDQVVNTVTDTPDIIYHPHAVPSEIFKKLPEKDVLEFKSKSFENSPFGDASNKTVFFWNNRNARRKQSGTLIFWFKEFLDRVGHDKAVLIMHTDAKDMHGQDLETIIKELQLDSGQVLISREKLPLEGMSMMYNMADCTINISDAEGFGLSTLESLSCETPIIVNMTGGLQEQVTDGENWFGFGVEPCAKAIIGSQDIPYIYEDRLNKEQLVDAMVKFHNLSKEERAALGAAGREHVLKNYNFENYKSRWAEILTDVHEKHGSWDTRKDYKTWRNEQL
jgi:glycosyltransferase involved in cell wall biosynthesis